MRRGFDFTMSKEMTNEMQEMIKTKGTNERMGDEPQAQENESKLIQANKALEKRDRVLKAAIRRCHNELAKRNSISEVEASKDAVEAAWNEYNQAISRYCMYAGADSIGRKELEEQPEEARRALYEWKALLNMMEEVVDKAEEYLESATKEDSWDELCKDEDGGNELDAKVEQPSTVNEASCMVCNVNEVAPELSAVNEVNEEALEVSAMNKVNEEAPEVSAVNKVNEVAPELSAVNKVNEESAEVQEEQNGTKVWEPGESGVAKLEEVKFDVITEAMMGSGVKEVMQLDGLMMMKVMEQSCCAKWDPGELLDAKDQIEMLDVEEVEILVNDDKVRLRGNVNWKAFYDAMALNNIVLFNTEALLIVMFLLRFENEFRRKCPIELSDYG